jgi:uncharacterized repeat protein (TIGR02543 family)
MKKAAITLLFAVSFLLSACFSPWRPDEAVLTLNLGGGADTDNRAVAYPPDKETEKNIEHKIHLSGPSEMDINPEKGVSTARITVVPGHWHITVQAFLDGELYAKGSGSVTVAAAQNYPVSIQMRYAGITYYTVTFDSNGGTGTTPEARAVPAGSGIELPGAGGLSNANASFGGWVTDPGATAARFAAGAFFTVNEDITLYAFWNTSTVTYTVTFYANGGTGTVPAITKQAGSDIIIPGGSELSRTGYTFGGWDTSEDGTGFIYNAGDSYTVNGNINLYARWFAEGATLCTVTFDANGGSGAPPSEIEVPADTSIDLPYGDGLTKTGYTFGGWNTNQFGTGDNHSAGSSYTVTGGIILYAKWDADTVTSTVTYTVTFDANGGDGTVPSETVNAGSSITLPSGGGLSKDGYTFGGWSINVDGTGTNYDAGSSYEVTGTITLYAKWNAIQYTVTFNANDGTPAPAQQTIDHNGKVTEPAAMIKAGYAFGGWYKDSAFTTAWIFASDTVTGDITLYAKWSPVTSINIILWVDEAAGKIQVANNPETITIHQSGNGNKSFTASFTEETASNVEWLIWGIPAIGDTAEKSITIFAEDYNPGTYQLLVRVTMKAAPYSTEIAFTVE